MSEEKEERREADDENYYEEAEERLSDVARELDEQLRAMRDDVQAATEQVVDLMHDLRRKPVRRLFRSRIDEVREEWQRRRLIGRRRS
jgi:gas vesicle protein